MQQKRLVNKEDINGGLTCITLSKAPTERSDIGTAKYINWNSVFNNEVGLFNATRNALKLCDTEFAIICDDDDPFPDQILYPEHGLIYGDFLVSHGFEMTVLKSSHWTYSKNLRNYWLIHKPIINTRNALKILDTVEPNDIHFHYFLYFMLAYCYGSDYDSRLTMWWCKNETGMHKYAHTLKNKSRNWLMTNADRFKKAILE